MVDIEHKCLELVNNNIGNLKDLLSDRTMLKTFIATPTNIDFWDRNLAFKSYIKIVTNIFNNCDINTTIGLLCTINDLWLKEPDIDIRLFLSVIIRLALFAKNIYELYLLDQFLYIMSVFSSHDIERGNIGPVTTNSVYSEEIRKLLAKVESRGDFELNIYKLKLKGQKQYLALLKNPETGLKIKALYEVLENLITTRKETFYSLELYELLSKMVNKRSLKGASSKEEEEQLSFFP